eukprot:gene15377-18240_t
MDLQDDLKDVFELFAVSVTGAATDLLVSAVDDIQQRLDLEESFKDACQATTNGVKHGANGVVFMAKSMVDLKNKMAKFIMNKGRDLPDVEPNIGRYLYGQSPVFKKAFDEFDQEWQRVSKGEVSIKDTLFKDLAKEDTETEIVSLAIQFGIKSLLVDANVTPTSYMGESIGDALAVYFSDIGQDLSSKKQEQVEIKDSSSHLFVNGIDIVFTSFNYPPIV